MTTKFSLEFKDSTGVSMFTLKFNVNNSTKLLTKVWLSTDINESDILLPLTGTQYTFYNGAELTNSNMAMYPSSYAGFNIYDVGYSINDYWGSASGDNAFDFSNGWNQFDYYGVLINPTNIPYFLNKYPTKKIGVLRIFSTTEGLETGTSGIKMLARIYSNNNYSNYSELNINNISTTLINLTNIVNTGGGSSSNMVVVVNPCFNEGTKILCLNKEDKNTDFFIEIEKLHKGDLVKTYLHGYKKVEMIGKNTMVNDTSYPISSNCMYVLRKEKFPELTEDLIITGNHSILVNELTEKESWVQNIIRTIEEKIEDKKLLLTAACEKVEQVKNNDIFTYYHIVLENENNDDSKYGIYANGLLCETISKNEFNQHNLIKINC